MLRLRAGSARCALPTPGRPRSGPSTSWQSSGSPSRSTTTSSSSPHCVSGASILPPLRSCVPSGIAAM
eukprot:6795401-Lingulodinium_polyedra.AAC.1